MNKRVLSLLNKLYVVYKLCSKEHSSKIKVSVSEKLQFVRLEFFTFKQLLKVKVRVSWQQVRRFVKCVMPYLQLIGALLHIIMTLKNLGWL